MKHPPTDREYLWIALLLLLGAALLLLVLFNANRAGAATAPQLAVATAEGTACHWVVEWARVTWQGAQPKYVVKAVSAGGHFQWFLSYWTYAIGDPVLIYGCLVGQEIE